MDPAAREALRQAAGAAYFHDATRDRLLYASDATREFYPPQAVVRAMDKAQVCRVLAACTRHLVPVVPRGAGSGLTGGALAVAGGVVLDLAGMNRILSLSVADQTAVVEPGVLTAELQAAAEKRGLFYPPDPASVGFSTIGGNVAENAGGLRAVKYGVTREYVLGLKAAIMDGRELRTGAATLKSVVGYDLTRLLVGSEGTLAVILEVTLRLLAQPEAKATVSGIFAELGQAVAAVQTLIMSGIVPTAVELVDQRTLAAVEAFAGLGLPPSAQAMVLVDVDGAPEVVARQAADLAGIIARQGADPVEATHDPARADSLWRARRAAGPAINRLAPGKHNEDIVVPLGHLGEMMARLRRVEQERGVIIATFGHAGDGNLHVNVMYQPEQAEAAHQAVGDVFAHTLALGGSLTGEHGVGIRKLGYVGAEMDPVALAMMRGVKRLFDPLTLLNPGKLLPPK
jgi:glycolate oxidase subunit GlcD